jgi:glycosyltransferase involved in cell wall biosynthesis
MKPRILVLADWYLPGNKGGGSVSAISNLIESVGDDFLFYLVTRDRDNTEDHPYSHVYFDRWVTVGKAQVLYTSNFSFRTLRNRIMEVAPQIIYLNSFFSRFTIKTLMLRRLGFFPASVVVLAPRGEFSPGALALKRLRKRSYLQVARRLGLYRGLIWQASSDLEKQQITAAGISNGTRNRGRLVVTPDVPSPNLLGSSVESQRPEKRTGAVRLIFLSRISRSKNLHFALKLLGAVRGCVELEIVGPAEDLRYWAECQEQIRALPENITVRSAGPVPHESVRRTLRQHQFLLLPTLGENFGYAILEALAAGCPALISDQTPWRDLRGAGAGWDLPLGRLDLWQNALQECVAMDDGIYQSMSQQARCLAENWCAASFFHRDNANMFRNALDLVAHQ